MCGIYCICTPSRFDDHEGTKTPRSSCPLLGQCMRGHHAVSWLHGHFALRTPWNLVFNLIKVQFVSSTCVKPGVFISSNEHFSSQLGFRAYDKPSVAESHSPKWPSAEAASRAWSAEWWWSHRWPGRLVSTMGLGGWKDVTLAWWVKNLQAKLQNLALPTKFHSDLLLYIFYCFTTILLHDFAIP